jgi:hypothetical protein
MGALGPLLCEDYADVFAYPTDSSGMEFPFKDPIPADHFPDALHTGFQWRGKLKGAAGPNGKVCVVWTM